MKNTILKFQINQLKQHLRRGKAAQNQAQSSAALTAALAIAS